MHTHFHLNTLLIRSRKWQNYLACWSVRTAARKVAGSCADPDTFFHFYFRQVQASLVYLPQKKRNTTSLGWNEMLGPSHPVDFDTMLGWARAWYCSHSVHSSGHACSRKKNSGRCCFLWFLFVVENFILWIHLIVQCIFYKGVYFTGGLGCETTNQAGPCCFFCPLISTARARFRQLTDSYIPLVSQWTGSNLLDIIEDCFASSPFFFASDLFFSSFFEGAFASDLNIVTEHAAPGCCILPPFRDGGVSKQLSSSS